jgi:hypothetical protein
MKRNDDIDALARLLDGGAGDESAASTEARSLAALATALEASAAPLTATFALGAPHTDLAVLPRPDFRASLRASLIEVARDQAGGPSVLSRMRRTVNQTADRWRHSSRVAAATGAAAVALSGGAVALASSQALPGDTLYSVKLALEDARLLLIFDDVARARRRLAYAEARLAEAEAAARAGDTAAAAIALREADATIREAAGALIGAGQSDPEIYDILADWRAKNRKRMRVLAPLFDGDARVAARDVLTGLDRIGARLGILTGEECDCPAARQSAAGGGADSFDINTIPPADEPFNACACVADDTGERAKPGGGRERGNRNRDDSAGAAPDAPREREPQAAGPPPKTDGEKEPDDPGSGGEQPPVVPDDPEAPDTGDENVDATAEDTVDTVDEVIDDVTKPQPPAPPAP